MTVDLAVSGVEAMAPQTALPQPESVANWLKSLAQVDPLQAAHSMLEGLCALNAQRLRVTLRQGISEQYFGAIQWLLPRLNARLREGVLPLSEDGRATFACTDQLLSELCASYHSLFTEQSRRLFGFAASGRALLPVLRALQLYTERLSLSYRTYASAPKGAWSSMHELYQFALRRGLAHRALDGKFASPAAVYKRALLTAFANPLQFLPGDLDLVEILIREHAGEAQVLPAAERPQLNGLFVIKPQRDVAGYAVSKRHHPVPQQNDLLLNSAPVAETLALKLAKLTSAGSLAELNLPPKIDEDRARALLARLLTHWGAAANRRANRLRTNARVDVCIGIEAIWAFLNSPEQLASPHTEWTVTNESPQGFALRHVNGPMSPVRVGEVVGLRGVEDRTCHVCVVRWVLSDTPSHLELGLEEIAPNARAVQLRRTRGGDGESSHALLLAEGPNHNRAQSLLAPAAGLDGTCEMSVGELQAKLRVKPTVTVENTGSVQLLQFSSVNPPAGS